MCKITMIRGFDDKIFFAVQSHDEAAKIMQLECLKGTQDSVQTSEILPINGGKVIDLDWDGQNLVG